MSIKTRFIVSAALLASLLAFRTESASACSCVPPGTPLEELGRSTAVFAGKAIRIDAGLLYSSADPVMVTFQVAQVWKGPEHARLTLHTERSGASCGYEFQGGQEYLVYASGPEADLYTGLCTRTQPLASAGDDLQALGEGTTPSDDAPGLAAGSQPALPVVAVAILAAGAVAILAAALRKKRT